MKSFRRMQCFFVTFYVCVLIPAINSLNLNNGTMPIIKNSLEGITKYFSKDNPVSLSCGNIEGVPVPSITWYKDGKQQLEGSSVNQVHEPGSYYCTARNENGVARTAECTVKEAELYRKSTKTETKNPVKAFYKNVYERLALECDPDNIVTSTPKELNNYQWFLGKKDATQADKFTALKVDPKRFIIAENGTFIISHLMISDANVVIKENYICTVGNIVTPSKDRLYVHFNRVSVFGYEDAKKELEAAYLYPESGGRSNVLQRTGVRNGQPLEIKCLFRGLPIQQVDWYIESEAGPIKVANDSTKLKLRDCDNTTCSSYNAIPMNEGMYFCQPRGKDLKVFYNVTVHEPPVWRVKPDVQRVYTGQKVAFRCDASGKPTPSVEWFINGESVSSPVKNGSDQVIVRGNELIFSESISTKFKGVQCLVKNQYGSKLADTYAVIIDQIEMANDTVIFINNTGEMLKLPCLVYYDSLMVPSVEWRHDGIPLTGPRRLQIGEDGARPVDTAKPFWEGLYECTANTDLGEEKSVTYLLYAPEVKPIQGARIIPKQSGMPSWLMWTLIGVAGFVFLVVIIMAIYCRAARSKQGDEYPVGVYETNAGNDPIKELAATGFRDVIHGSPLEEKVEEDEWKEEFPVVRANKPPPDVADEIVLNDKEQLI